VGAAWSRGSTAAGRAPSASCTCTSSPPTALQRSSR
jgi:hypothetical protein